MHKVIQIKTEDGNWMDYNGEWVMSTDDMARYLRIKPEPTIREWTMDELPVDGWFRDTEQRIELRVIGVSVYGVSFASRPLVSWEYLCKHYTHSHDRKTWHPCGVEVAK